MKIILNCISVQIIDVCMDIYVMMSSDLYGTCRHCLYGTLSHPCRRNCNPFGNVATVIYQCIVQDVALVDHADIVYSICNIFHFNCYTSKANTSNLQSSLVGPDSGLSLVLKRETNLNEDYYTCSKIENVKSIHLDNHPQNTLPFIESPGLDFISGLSTSIEVHQKQFNRLKAPYSHCQPKEIVTILYKEYIMEPNYCVVKCLVQTIFDRCHFVSITVGGVAGDPRNYYLHLELKNNLDVDISKAMCEVETLKLLRDITADCKRCEWNCVETKYEIKVS